MTTDVDAHRLELLHTFKNTPEDLAANRAGRLGPGQVRRMRRGAVNATLAMIGADLVLVAIIIFVASRPISGPRWVLIVVVILAGLAVGFYQSARLRRALRDGTVECLSGEVRVAMRGRSGWWLSVADRSFHLPVRFWHVGPGLTYRVYVAPAAQLIVAMEPASGPAFPAQPPMDPAALRSWATTLCTNSATDSETLLGALHFDGVLVDGIGVRRLEPPVAQTVRTTISERQGALFSMEFTPGPLPITRTDLDAEFGEGHELVRVHYDSDFRVMYRVTVDGAPFTCDVTGSYRGLPMPDAVAIEIAFRRQPAG